jgi:hypothetical protein
MRNRHLPRVCRHRHAPMASGAHSCWRCGTEWATETPPPTTLQLVADPALEADDRPVDVPLAAPRLAAASASVRS